MIVKISRNHRNHHSDFYQIHRLYLYHIANDDKALCGLNVKNYETVRLEAHQMELNQANFCKKCLKSYLKTG